MINIIIKRGNIVKEDADAIVNAANNELIGGGGVDGAIHCAAGWDELDAACEKIGYCETGEAVITPAFGIKQVKHIIHTVGPCCFGDISEKERNLLYNCYYNSLKLADQYECRKVSFPSIATGIFGFPLEEAPAIFKNAIKDYEAVNRNIRDVTMVCFDVETEEAFRKNL